MTNEEALSILHCPDAYGGIHGEKYGEALSMAMEALKREPCEDCVSRQEIVNLINLRLAHLDGVTPPKEMGFVDGVRDGYCRIRSDIQSLVGKDINVITTEDCISRQAVLNDIQSNWDWETVDGITATTVLKQVMTDITNAPSVTSARPKGKWIYLNEQEESYGEWYQCSVCHSASYEENFCPYCGAEMVGTTERSDKKCGKQY